MATITEVKMKIQELSPAQFQEFCDSFLRRIGYTSMNEYGLKAGTGNTKIGNPDAYFRTEEGKYIHVVHTTQKDSIFTKIKEDICKCFDTSKTGLKLDKIGEIIACHTSSSLSAGDDDKLHKICSEKGIKLTIYGVDEIAYQVERYFPSLAKNYLHLHLDTDQIKTIRDFVSDYDKTSITAPLNTDFLFRENEIKDVVRSLSEKQLIVIKGKAGVGKTRLVLEALNIYSANNDCRVFCLKNNGQNFYEDLVSVTEETADYVFFIDDANELNQLDTFLSYTIKKGIKIIVTVRDYASDLVIGNFSKYAKPIVNELSSFSDEEIKRLLNKNLGIINEKYVNQIIEIAEGNARLAYMAGTLAIEKKDLSSIHDSTQLYDDFYRSFISKREIGKDIGLCFTLCILLISRIIEFKKIDSLENIVKLGGLSLEQFKSNLYSLYKLEVIEIHQNEVASIADQSLANYLLYYVLINHKAIKLSALIIAGYKDFHHGIINAINILVNLFYNEEVFSYCKREVCIAWEQLSDEDLFVEFVKAFHVFRPEESLLIAKKMIDDIPKENFSIHEVDFNLDNPIDDVLMILAGYQFSAYMREVLDLLLSYSGKNRNALVTGYKWLEHSYGITSKSLQNRFENEIIISSSLYDFICAGNEVAALIGFKWAEYTLKFYFCLVESGRHNSLNICYWNVSEDVGLRKYRDICWDILSKLAVKTEYRNKIFPYINNYGRSINSKTNQAVLIGDKPKIEILINSLAPYSLGNEIVIYRLIEQLEKKGIVIKIGSSLFCSREWKLYNLLYHDYYRSGMEHKEFEKKVSASLSVYGKALNREGVKDFVVTLNTIFSDEYIKAHLFEVSGFPELVVDGFDSDNLLAFIEDLSLCGNDIVFRPYNVLVHLHELKDSVALWSYLEPLNLPQKSEWMYEYFNRMPDDRVTSDVIDNFLAFIKNDIYSDSHFSFRQIEILDKFINIEPNIYPIVCSILMANVSCREHIVYEYFNLMFHTNTYNPEKLVKLFNGNIGLLQKIYFFMMRMDILSDYNGYFLVEFLKLDDGWLKEYSDYLWDSSHDNTERIAALWKSENFMKYFDFLFYSLLDSSAYCIDKGFRFNRIMAHTEGSDDIVSNQKKWLVHIVEKNIDDEEKIIKIFTIICELSDDMRRLAIKRFLELNGDFNLFKRIRIESICFSLTAPELYEKIRFLESILPYIPDEIKFLEHRVLISRMIERCQNEIEKAKIDEIRNNILG